MNQLEDRLAIAELVNRYAYHLDLWHAADWVALFTEEAVLDESALEMGIHRGHAGLADYVGALASDVVHVVHLMMNHVILEQDGHLAKGSVFALVEAVTRSSGHARYYIRYEDSYEKSAARWRFARRVIRPLFPPQILGTAGA